MLKESIHVCRSRNDVHLLTPDPAWSRYSFGFDVCVRDQELSDKRDNPLANAAAGVVARLFDRARAARAAGA